jgi:GAF domain-containing protein
MIAIERLADVFVEIADTLVGDFDLIEFLHGVAVHAVEVSEETAAGVLLTDHRGRLQHVGASREDVRLLELFQLQNSEGPCLDCYNSGEPVTVPDLGAEALRWPRFATAALEAGFHSVHAFPLRLRKQVIGAVNVFGAQRREWAASEHKIVQALADVAAIALIQEQAIARAEVVQEQLQGALNSRIAIEQAKGAVARTLGITPERAFEAMRQHARDQRRTITEVAHDLVADPDAANELPVRRPLP